MEAVESMDAWVWLSLTIVKQVSFLTNMYADGNKFYSTFINKMRNIFNIRGENYKFTPNNLIFCSN